MLVLAETRSTVQSILDPEITKRKFERELEHWQQHSQYQERGWIILGIDENLPAVEIAFLGHLSISAGSVPLAVVMCAVRVSYDSYDLLPPSVTFIDALTRKPCRPHVGAFMSTPDGMRSILIDGHPITRQPFLCLPGVREYHNHPQHTGDDWLLHRPTGAGNLLTLCERIWRFMVKNVLGLTVNVQAMPVWPLQARLVIGIAQGDFVQGEVPKGKAVVPKSE